MKCSESACGQDATWRAQLVRNRVIVGGDDGYCDEHARQLWESSLADHRKGIGPVYNVPGAACVELELIMADFVGDSARVLLREVDGTKLIFFPVGFVRCCELLWAVHGYHYNTLTLHVALKRLVEHVDGTLSHVLLDWDTPNGQLEACAIIRRQPEVIKLQMHPSDGLVLAMMTQLPFVVAEEVFSKLGGGPDGKRGRG